MNRWLAAAAALAMLAGGCEARPAPGAAKRELYLISALPLLFGEGFGLDFAKPDVVAALERSYILKPIDLPSQLPAGAVALIAQPRAFPAEELVALDQWVRGGGRLVLLADPMLEWPSERPLGDRLRPPVMFADTGLLQHWGLRLDAPEQRGLKYARGDGDRVALISPGVLVRESGTCAVAKGGWMARCALGKGTATIVADADFLNAEAVVKAGASPANGARLVERLVENQSTK